MYGGIRNWKILGEDKVVKVCRSRPLFSLENIFNLKPRKYKKKYMVYCTAFECTQFSEKALVMLLDFR